eukprot:1148435-Pelagomonas_calceolata.AAC.9
METSRQQPLRAPLHFLQLQLVSILLIKRSLRDASKLSTSHRMVPSTTRGKLTASLQAPADAHQTVT